MIITDVEKEKRIREIFSDSNIRVINEFEPLKEWVYKNIDDLYDFEITKGNYESYMKEDAVCSKNIRTLAYLARALYFELEKKNVNNFDALKALSAASRINKTYYRILKEQAAREKGNSSLEQELFPKCGMNEYAIKKYWIMPRTSDEDVKIYERKRACN